MNTRNKLRLIMPVFIICFIVVVWTLFGQAELVGIVVYIVIMILTILTIFYLVRFFQDYQNIEKDAGYRRFGKNQKGEI